MMRATLILLAIGLLSFGSGANVSHAAQGKTANRPFAQASASATSLDFGNQVVDTVSKVIWIKLSNNTDKRIQIRRVDTVGGGDFVVDSLADGCTDSEIDVGKDCSIGVVFFPLVEGKRTGFVHIIYEEDQDNPQKITLNGNGIKTNK